MTKKNVGLAKTEVIRIHPRTMEQLQVIKKMLGMGASYKPGDVIEQLIRMAEGKKIGASPSFRETQRQSPNPRLNEGAIENDEQIYKSLYEDTIKTNRNYVKIVQKLASQLGISYSEAMNMKINAPIRT